MYAEAPYYVYDGKMIEDACGCLRRARCAAAILKSDLAF